MFWYRWHCLQPIRRLKPGPREIHQVFVIYIWRSNHIAYIYHMLILPFKAAVFGIGVYLPVHCGDQRHAGLCLGRRPCTSRRRVQGRSQGTTLRASDLHNARATILNPFYNMEYKIIKKIRQNTTWIEADILGINLTPNRYNALAPAIVYVSNDVTIPFNSVTSQ